LTDDLARMIGAVERQRPVSSSDSICSTSGTGLQPGGTDPRCSAMEHKGIKYIVVQTAAPTGWRWTVELTRAQEQDW